MTAQKKPYITASEYLSLERAATHKAELFAGQVVAMAGATLQHNEIVANLIAHVKGYLKGKSCRIYPSDLRVRIGLGDSFAYPDATIVCGKPEMLDEAFDTVINPSVIIEVMSKSTEEKDRGAKFFAYMQIPSLKEYLLISSTNYFVQTAVRQSDGSWKFEEITNVMERMPIKTITHEVPLMELYENVTF
jgi:Uma2 family endonuclease